jgi:hypothetical protein
MTCSAAASIAPFSAAPQHRRIHLTWPGARRFTVVKAGEDRTFVIGEWDSMQSLTAARPHMIAVLDGFRHTLDALGDGLGVTDPISGTVVPDLMPAGWTAKAMSFSLAPITQAGPSGARQGGLNTLVSAAPVAAQGHSRQPATPALRASSTRRVRESRMSSSVPKAFM